MDDQRVVAVVVSFWPERTANVVQIVRDLLDSTRPPDRVIVLDNNPDGPGMFRQVDWGTDIVDIVEGSANWETRGKYVVGLLDPADFYVLCDDDTSVGPRSIEVMLNHAGPNSVFGYWGVRLQGESFMDGSIIQPAHVRWPTPVDAFHGRVIFASWQALLNMLALETKVRLGPDRWPAEGDDLIIGLANPDGSAVVPLEGDAAFVDLDDGGVAMQHRPGYFEMRDEFCAAVLRAREAP